MNTGSMIKKMMVDKAIKNLAEYIKVYAEENGKFIASEDAEVMAKDWTKQFKLRTTDYNQYFDLCVENLG